MTVRNILFSLCALLSMSGQLLLGQVSIKADKPSINSLESPTFPNVPGARKRFRAKNWLEVEVELKAIKKSVEGDLPFIQEVGVDWYIAIPDPKGKGTLLLTAQADYINLPIKEDVRVSVYLSPTSLKLLTGKDRVVSSDVKAVAAVFTVNGEEVAVANNVSAKKWWESPNLSRDTNVELLTKDQTPFKFHWWDLYAEGKLK